MLTATRLTLIDSLRFGHVSHSVAHARQTAVPGAWQYPIRPGTATLCFDSGGQLIDEGDATQYVMPRNTATRSPARRWLSPTPH